MKLQKFKFFIFNIFLPVFLMVFWFTASLLFNNTYSFTTLVYSVSGKQLTQYPVNKLLKGEKIKGEFKANDNYLGLVTLRFKDYVKHDYNEEDYINFRIKEKKSRNWYYIGDYRSGAIENMLQFPFGFPAIEDSKNKIYEFEIVSLNGNENNAVELNISDPQFTSVYKFSKQTILSNSNSAMQFILKKIVTSFTNVDFLLRSTLYFIPMFLYLIKKGVLKSLSRKIKLPIVVLSIIVVDIVCIQEFYIGILFLLAIGWFVSIREYKLAGKSNYLLAFILITIWLPLMYFNTKYIQNKINIWVYFFFFTGTVQAIIEEKYKNNLHTNTNDKKSE